MSKKTIILILTAWVITVIILLILIFSNRNSTSGESQFSLEITCDQFLAEKHITQNIRMQSGDSLGVSLCSNGTTGFQWEQHSNISDTSVLEQTLHKFLPPENSNSNQYFKLLKESANNLNLKDLSMGMSSDYDSAISNGSTYVRLGTLILGKRKS